MSTISLQRNVRGCYGVYTPNEAFTTTDGKMEIAAPSARSELNAEELDDISDA